MEVLAIIAITAFISLIVAMILFIPIKLNNNQHDAIYLNRKQKCLAVYNNYPKINQSPIPNGGLYFNDYFKTEKYYGLRDFFYAASYKSYLPCGYTHDIVSYDAIKNVLLQGARVINLDIFYKGPFPFADDSSIIVGNVINGQLSYLEGTKENQQYLQFANCLQIINELAWKKTDAPLFLYLNLEFDANSKLEYQIASQLAQYCNAHFLDKYYSFQRVNIGDIPVNQAKNKLIILTNRKPVDGMLNELTNGLMTSQSTNLIMYTIDKDDMRSGGVTTHFAKKEDAIQTCQFNLVAVIKTEEPNPDNKFNPKIDSQNYDTSHHFEIGLSISFMNWQVLDEPMKQYLEKFKDGGMVLKPANLIYQPRPKPRATLRNKKFDYTNRTVAGLGGFYNFNT